MHFASNDLSGAEAYRLLAATVLPRPIALVTTVSAEGVPNAAPFSFFNAMGSKPPVVAMGIEPRPDGSYKDTSANIIETREFVVNLVDEPLADKMNACAATLAPEVNELEEVGLKTIPSSGVRAPRVEDSPVSMECKLLQTVDLAGGGSIVIGEVIHFHLQDRIVSSLDPLRIDTGEHSLIGRLSASDYCRTTDRFQLQRPG